MDTVTCYLICASLYIDHWCATISTNIYMQMQMSTPKRKAYKNDIYVCQIKYIQNKWENKVRDTFPLIF